MLCAMLALFILEMIGLTRDNFVTISEVVRTYVPKWTRAMILGWLCYHFLIQGT